MLGQTVSLYKLFSPGNLHLGYVLTDFKVHFIQGLHEKTQ